MISIIIVIIISIITCYIVYTIYNTTSNIIVIKSKMPLEIKKDVVMPDETMKNILGSAGTTVMAYIKLQEGDRTSQYSDKNKDKFIPVIQVENNWYSEIIIIGIQSSNYKTNQARLRIKLFTTDDKKEEIINLLPIPKQKWVFIAILREGRRFDVIYDNKIIASHRVDKYPVVISSPLSIGNSSLSGMITHVMYNKKRLSLNEVERERLAHIDSNNVVIEDTILSTFPLNKITSQCPPGFPCTIDKLQDSLNEWDSPYA